MLDTSHYPKRNSDIRNNRYNYSHSTSQKTNPEKLMLGNSHILEMRPSLGTLNVDKHIVHISPNSRQDVVGGHGYIALNICDVNKSINKTNNTNSPNNNSVPVERSGPVGEEFSDYTLRELESLRREVRQWKKDFKRKHNRFPMKADILADTSGINERIERVRAIEVLQMGAVRFGKRTIPNSNTNMGNTDAFGIDSDLAMSDISNNYKNNNDSENESHYSTECYQRLDWSFYSGTNGLGSRNGISNLFNESQKFYYPKGCLVSDKVFFEYDGEYENYIRSEKKYEYEFEEWEINNAVGVTQDGDQMNNNNEKELSPLRTYEPNSSVLDAIRKAIESPIKQFRHAGADDTVEGEYNPDVIAQYITFREAAFRNAEPYGDDSYTVLDGVSLLNDDDDEELVVSIAPIALSRRRIWVIIRKILHRELKKWKCEYAITNGRRPEVTDILQDEAMCDVYKAYQRLREETCKPKKEGETAVKYDEDNDEDDEDDENTREGTQNLIGTGNDINNGASNGRSGLLTPLFYLYQRWVLNDADAIETRTLAREVSEWRNSFKDTHGRNPNLINICVVPEIAEKYFRLKELKEKRESHGSEEESIDSPLLCNKDVSVNYTNSTNGYITLAKFEHEETVDRADTIAEEMLSFMSLNLSKAKADAKLCQVAKYDVREGGKCEKSNNMSPVYINHRIKELGMMLIKWKAQFELDFDREPKSRDIRNDSSIFVYYREYIDLKGLMSTPRHGLSYGNTHVPFSNNNTNIVYNTKRIKDKKEVNIDFTSLMRNIDFVSVEEAEILADHRSRLADAIKEWTNDFINNNKRAPTHSDMKSDSNTLQTYEAYVSIPDDIVERAKSRERVACKGSPANERNMAIKPYNIHRDVNLTLSNEGAKLKYEMLARKKELSNLLNCWKSEFEKNNDRVPYKYDLNKDAVAAALFEEFLSLKKAIAELDSTIEQKKTKK